MSEILLTGACRCASQEMDHLDVLGGVQQHAARFEMWGKAMVAIVGWIAIAACGGGTKLP